MATFNYNFVDDGYTPPTGSGSYSFNMQDEIFLPEPPPDPLPAYFGFSFDTEYTAPTGSGSFSFGFALASGTCPDEWVETDCETWVEDPGLEWQEGCADPFTYLKQIWTDSNYVYAATTDGLNIVDVMTEQSYAQITYDCGFNSVWADDTKVYMATTEDGVKYINKSDISAGELIQYLKAYMNYPTILSDSIRYIHGNGDYFVVCSASGVNAFGPDPYYQKASTGNKHTRKCFMTSTGVFYYTTYDGSWKLNRVDNVTADWIEPDVYYEPGTYAINAGVDLLDMFITENTSEIGTANTIFLATTSGVFVIDEGTGASDTYYTA